MNTREVNLKARELRNEAADLERLFHDAVVKYLSTIIEVESCCEPDKERTGKACLEEICSWYEEEHDLVVIEYSIMNTYGECYDNREIRVSSSEIDKYLFEMLKK